MNALGKYKILIADDDVNILKAIMYILIKNTNYLILTTIDGKTACEIADVEYPDLIIMDWQMPVMNGIEATIQLKRNDLTKNIPIIISTGVMVDSNDLSTALVKGAVDYLRKPINEVELIARVENALRMSDAYLRIEQQNIELQSHLASKLINLQQLNELKIATIKQLTSIKEQASDIDNQNIKEAIVKTERLLYSKIYQVDWDDFEFHFEFIHQNFFKKIRNIIGDLTPNELRLCAFIRLNMTNKEISLINYTTADSVNTARKRLKKKIGLQPHESLQTFIFNL